MTCSDCNQEHENQRTAYPVGATVRALNDIGSRMGHVKAATLGEIIGHCDDGRAQIRFSTTPPIVHTFHYPAGVVALEVEHAQTRPATGKRMDASEYQRLAARTLIDEPDFQISNSDFMIVWNALGLAGEAGEVADTIKKGILHQHGLDKDKAKKELGDVCWYIAALCSKLGFDLADVMTANIEKLKVRYPDGYKPADSVARVDVRG